VRFSYYSYIQWLATKLVNQEGSNAFKTVPTDCLDLEAGAFYLTCLGVIVKRSNFEEIGIPERGFHGWPR
jgi:hypothetical protein